MESVDSKFNFQEHIKQVGSVAKYYSNLLKTGDSVSPSLALSLFQCATSLLEEGQKEIRSDPGIDVEMTPKKLGDNKFMTIGKLSSQKVNFCSDLITGQKYLAAANFDAKVKNDYKNSIKNAQTQNVNVRQILDANSVGILAIGENDILTLSDSTILLSDERVGTNTL
jgi:hypothetical protein